jgi:hypothetical protein
MRAGVLLLCLAACRFHFDALPDGATDVANPIPGGLNELCKARTMTAIRGGAIFDDMLAITIANQLAATCPLVPAVREVSQDDPGVLDPTTNRPLLTSKDLAVIGGGEFFQRAIGYLIIADTPLILEEMPARVRIIERATNTVLLDRAPSSFSNTHDVGIVELVHEPIGGSSVLSFQARVSEGTIAMGYWFSNIQLPQLATTTQRWFVIEWTSTDTDPAPSAGDSYAIVAMGP